ncbi:hypothetical protein RSOLAG1IB_06164 [Rhizoctonia solani AG-1 IB]|uniref:Peptidase C14 caspase domain-containing protein n=1 Tax=Thanatephorus cucumeris (strain AG1-IB / isolate 7/3/14) TaxID=1108050 RepID=A0A0B7F8I3_THACB|nr:hypothetical protein RSOLAG1IB_06164 [Rhizoctonia solani AG-1 IB]
MIKNDETPDCSVQYITGDRKEDGLLEGLAAEELTEMFAKFRPGTTLVAITDFCHAGNAYHLQFQLSVCPDGSTFWKEVEEWSNDSKFDQKNKIRAPMIHIAGSSRLEQAYETGRKGGKQHSDQFATDTPLAKAFLGGHGGVSRAAYAVLCLNKYTGFKWSSNGPAMDLYGADRDMTNFLEWLTGDEKFPNLKISSIHNTSRTDIKSYLENLVTLSPGVVFVYIQGHGLPELYITGDGRGSDGEYIGLKSTELIELFSRFENNTSSIVITDFCHSGNFLHLRYRLEVDTDGKRADWVEVENWTQGSGDTTSHPSSQMLHIAGSADNQLVYETGNLGGYFTNALSKAEPKTLPELLAELRATVDAHLGRARNQGYISQEATQVPQIYSRTKLLNTDWDRI